MSETTKNGSAPAEILVAIDDGHSEIKVAYLEDGTSGAIRNFSFPSRTVRGFEEMDPSGAAPPDAYVTFDVADADPKDSESKGTQMLVVPRGRPSSERGENRTQEYPVSDRNRVLVHHALHKIAAGREVRFNLATALPYSDFHMPASGKHNVELIGKKKENLAKSVMAIDTKSFAAVPPKYRLSEQAVFSEGVATFFDHMLAYDGSQITPDSKFASRFEHSSSYAVVDVGGKTTDIVFGSWTGNAAEPHLININKSTSLKEGTLDAADQLGEAIKQKFNLRRVNDPERALFTGKVPIFGEPAEISELVDAALDRLFQKIKEPLLRHIEDASDLAYVIFVGGGSILLKERFGGLLNKSVILAPESPQYANANGMLKVLKAGQGA